MRLLALVTLLFCFQANAQEETPEFQICGGQNFLNINDLKILRYKFRK